MGAPRTMVVAGLGAGLLAAGFGLGAFMTAGAPPVERIVHVTDPAPPPPPPPPPSPPAPARVPTAPSPPSTPDLSDADREALRGLLSRIPDTEVPTGTGVLTGRVRTEEGAPLPDVEISCSPEAPRAARTPPVQDPDPVDSAAATYRWARFRRNSRKAATTDAAGGFRFEGLADVKHRIEAKRKGWQFRAKDHRSMYEARPGAVVEITASRSVEVRIEVTWPGTAAPENLQVQFRAGSSTSSSGFSPENPIANVKPGAYDVQAVAGTQQELKSDPQAVEIPADGEPPVLRFVLKGRPGISGRILFAEGEEFEQVQVLSQRLARDQKAEPAIFASSFDRGGGGRSREQGRYFLPDLAPGRYAVGVSRGWNLPVVAVEEVEVADGPVERDLRVPPLLPGEYVVLTVLGPDGAVLRDYQVTTGYRTPNSSSSGGSTFTTRPDGTRWILHHAAGGKEDPEGTWWVDATTPKFGTKRGEYRRGAQDSVTIRFDEPGRVDVRLEGYRGHSHEGRLRLSLQAATEGGPRGISRGRSGDERIADDGTQTFLQVQPGEYVLNLQVALDRMAPTVAKIPVTVKGGRNDVALKVPLLHAVTILGADGQVFARGKGDGSFTMFARADGDGKAVLDGLPEGEYEIVSGQKNQTIRVPAQVEVKF